MAAARARRTVRLKTAKGTRRVRLPRPGPRRPSPGSPVDLLEALAAAVEDRARRFRRRVRCGIPIGRARIDKSVHDLRTSARRLLAALEGLRPFVERKRHRRLRRRIERVLDRSGGLRDVGVELQMLSALGNDEATAALRPLRERLRDKHEALARKLHRQLRRRGARRLRRDIRRVLEGSGRKRSAAAASVRSTAHEAARDGFSRLRKSRLAVRLSLVSTTMTRPPSGWREPSSRRGHSSFARFFMASSCSVLKSVPQRFTSQPVTKRNSFGRRIT